MKKLIPTIIAVLFLGGCGGFQIQKSIDTSNPNVFQTIIPKVKIEIGKDFVFVSENKAEYHRKFNVVTKQYYGPKISQDFYTYIWKSDSAIIHIKIKSLPHGHFIQADREITLKPSFIREKDEYMGNEVWRTGFRSHHYSGPLNKELRKYGVVEQENKVCFFLKVFIKRFFKKAQFTVSYIEIATEDEHFLTNKIGMKVTKDREQFISDFIKRADAAITIIEGGS